MNRRQFLRRIGGSAALLGSAGCLRSRQAMEPSSSRSAFRTRGAVLVPEDLSWREWPERAAHAGLTTLALHHQNSPQAVIDCVESDVGQDFLRRCRRLGLQVEFELHAMKELLPRQLFARHPGLFRMNDKGERVGDFNCCVHAADALEILAENAVKVATRLKPTTGRYFFWGDDGVPWCACPKCRELSDTEQALLVENHLVKALRRVDRRATLAHLAYHNTLTPPQKVKPDPAVFLEYAPIHRRYDVPYAEQTAADAPDGLPALDRNLEVFPRATAQVLEYWLDVSRFSGWKRPAQRIPWSPKVFASDAQVYAARGIGHVTTFAAWLDADYVRAFGEPACLEDYGRGLAAQRKANSR